MLYPKELIQTLGFSPPYSLSVGYYWYDSKSKYIEYWSKDSHGAVPTTYESITDTLLAVNTLNNKTKELLSITPDYALPDESKVDTIGRLRSERGISLTEAKNIVEGIRPKCIHLIDSLNRLVTPISDAESSACIILDSHTVLPSEVIDVLNLDVVSVIELPTDNQWELIISNPTERFKTSLRLVSDKDWTLYDKNRDGGKLVIDKKLSYEFSFRGTKEQCLNVDNLITQSYKAGENYISQQVKSVLSKN